MLVLGLGVNRSEIYCTSDGDIPTGVNFPEHIKNNINAAELVVLILTANYMESHFCLNEMGAAWANNQNIYPIIIPPETYKILDRSALRGVTNVLNANEEDLQKLRDEFEAKNLTGNIRSVEYRHRGKQLLDSIKKYNKQREKEGPQTVPVETYKKLQKEVEELNSELEDKIKESDSKDALIEELKKLKDQTKVKQVLRKHNSNEWDELQEFIDEASSLINDLGSMMASLIYHDRTFSFTFTPEYDEGWTAIHKLATRKLVFQDENKVTINDDYPAVKKALSAVNLLDDAIEGMSEEVFQQFVEEYGMEPDLSNIEFWEKVLRIRGIETSK
ncbi:toll/interleukin-1 receptor domain-containing protein [Brevibacillus borstelensis]|uniref:toll/interleukin-1 receptor domain-containing protein n=1 Tax=Brevibacillus borstelensis TaxID=45462 RepID=UPI002E21C0BB|nr:TIR domain-containing protein [Brevibacillus borstelensis]MED1745750.1 TIR domain-containing protein [Brevibacillus borstelensis]